MSIYAISDLHLSLGTEKPMDVFKGWNNYVEKLELNWREKVKNEDTVVIAGDISWALKLDEAERDFKFIESLPGKKIILKGNHDYWWSSTKKINEFFEKNRIKSVSILHNSAVSVENLCICGTRGWLYDSKEESDKKILLREVGRLERSIDSCDNEELTKVVFLHYPPVYGEKESGEIINILVERNIKKCYYGHIHGGKSSKNLKTGEYKGVNLELIACDYLDFCPKLIN